MMMSIVQSIVFSCTGIKALYVADQMTIKKLEQGGRRVHHQVQFSSTCMCDAMPLSMLHVFLYLTRFVQAMHYKV